MRYAFLILFTLMCMSQSVFANEKTVQDTPSLFSGAYLMKICEQDSSGAEVIKGGKLTCQSYIAGIIDYHKLLRTLGTAPSIDFCVPNTAKLNDLQLIIWQYLKDNAHHDAFNAAPAVTIALFSAYPCGN